MEQELSDHHGVVRCPWAGPHDDYRAYHDNEWGRPVVEETALFERLCLEGFQAGLSWLTVLRKRDRFREVFAGFDPAVVARYGETEVELLLGDAGIIRHRGKIESTINNAARCLELAEQFGSLAGWLWSWEPDQSVREIDGSIPASTPTSAALSRDLKKRAWSFIGPTTIYAFMQAVGMVNDHLPDCWAHSAVEAERAALLRPVR